MLQVFAAAESLAVRKPPCGQRSYIISLLELTTSANNMNVR